MSDGSAIQWTDATWNPVTGCTRVSAGCNHCYAVGMTHRLEKMGQAKYTGLTVKLGPPNGSNPDLQDPPHGARRVRPKRHFNGVVKCHEDALEKPSEWRKARRIFVNSMSDLFHKDVPTEFIARVFAVMGLYDWHTYQILTKRPERMAAVLNDPAFAEMVEDAVDEMSTFADAVAESYGYYDPTERYSYDWRARDHARLPMRNVWLGTSCEDQAAADERIPELLKCPASIRFISAEPLLGEIDFRLRKAWSDGNVPYGRAVGRGAGDISWVIVGGESGAGARPYEPLWGREIIEQCRVAGVPVFHKQMGSNVVTSNFNALDWPDGTRTEADGRHAASCRVRLNDPKGGNMSEWPEDLRVREMPEGVKR